MSDSPPVRARYIGYTKDTENHGDEALCWIIKRLLAPGIEVVFTDAETDLALLGGGTLINQSPWLIEMFQQTLDRSRGGIVFGTGVGDTLFWGDTFSHWNSLLERCQYVGVRGPLSLQLLQQAGLNKAEVLGDPYLAIAPPLEPSPVPRSITINFGTTNNSLLGGDEAGFIESMRALLLQLQGDGWHLNWLSVWSRDLDIMRDLRSAWPVDPGPLYDARTQAIEALAAIAASDIFLGEKLHACAMAAVAGTPFIAYEYQPKVRDFAESVGMGSWVVSTRDREPEGLRARINTLALQRQVVADRLRRQVTRRRQDILDAAAHLQHWAATLGPRP